MKPNTYLLPKLAVLTGLIALAQPAISEVVFEERFDDLQDWTSTMHSTKKAQTVDAGDVIPKGWYGIYQHTTWSPETGYPDKHASLEILAENSEKARGGAGKSAVFWRESYSEGWSNWASDAHFVKLLDQEYEQLYVEFYIRFSENWWQRDPAHKANWQSKIFRIGHWSREGSIWNSQTGDVNPRMFWNYKQDNYGVRNALVFRHGPPGKNEKMPQEASKNYTSHPVGAEEEGQPLGLANALNPNQLLSRLDGLAEHEQVFGKSGTWTKIAFFVRMNSEPGVPDGIFRQWVNDQRVVNLENMEWLKDYPGAERVGWNYIAIGGNDYFQAYPNEERFEDWYAIDDVVVATKPRATEPLGKETAPNPPSNISISK